MGLDDGNIEVGTIFLYTHGDLHLTIGLNGSTYAY